MAETNKAFFTVSMTMVLAISDPSLKRYCYDKANNNLESDLENSLIELFECEGVEVTSCIVQLEHDTLPEKGV